MYPRIRLLIGQTLAGLVLFTAFVGTASAGPIYDLANDWSNISNPSGTWTYGHYTSGLDPSTFSSFTNSGPNGTFASLQVWDTGSAADPNIIKNTGADVDTTPLFSNILFTAGNVTLGPFNGPTVARWIAPIAGTFFADASFATVQEGNSTPNAYISLNGAAVIDLGAVANGLVGNSIPLGLSGLSTDYTNTIAVAMGDYVDFIVWGANANNKTTQVSATLTQVPEPSTLALLGAGLLGLFMRRKRVA